MEGCQFPLSSRRPRTLAGRDLDSYTMNLHFALVGTPSRVAEIIPPAIRTTLGGIWGGAQSGSRRFLRFDLCGLVRW